MAINPINKLNGTFSYDNRYKDNLKKIDTPSS